MTETERFCAHFCAIPPREGAELTAEREGGSEGRSELHGVTAAGATCWKGSYMHQVAFSILFVFRS